LNISVSKGKGCWIWDENGKCYLDALSGIAVNTLGHSHKKLTEELSTQIQLLIHTSNLYKIPLQEELAKKLCELTKLNSVFFCNSGLEANEAAIKIARKYGTSRGFSQPKIIVFEKAFHGRSFATLAASSNKKNKEGFGPLLDGFIRVPYNNIEEIKKISKSFSEISAVFLESIQGEGGINLPDKNFLINLKNLCKRENWLLIMDEVQSGMGRTGKWFAYQWAGIIPDIIPIAKGLGSGIPVGAVVVNKKCSKILEPGNHGSTFGGNPLAMKAGLVTIESIENECLLKNVTDRGNQLIEGLKSLIGKLKGIKDIRGRGLMIGIEFNDDCKVLVKKALDQGLLINVTENKIVRLLPPLIISKNETEILLGRLVSVIKNHLKISE
jgi:acetylornithine aminotransferase